MRVALALVVVAVVMAGGSPCVVGVSAIHIHPQPDSKTSNPPVTPPTTPKPSDLPATPPANPKPSDPAIKVSTYPLYPPEPPKRVTNLVSDAVCEIKKRVDKCVAGFRFMNTACTVSSELQGLDYTSVMQCPKWKNDTGSPVTAHSKGIVAVPTMKRAIENFIWATRDEFFNDGLLKYWVENSRDHWRS
ncbi:hypothetical protein GWK47_042994 [Chionoecetes opilio]|uniref:Uncharacterized protein n=1 Tax=Chionoecetes opilio TaxID=41210 RepID=A0A8J4YGN1_CHIOP|nr:hypothetical protein GWK47_042994 [Chionoecetes opilio]